MIRYLFRETTAGNENADVLIDAQNLAQARSLYNNWCLRVIGEVQNPTTIWELPEASLKPQALDWVTNIEEAA